MSDPTPSPPGQADSQAEIVAFLEREFGAGAPCKRIDTHAASVFLAGDRAWKLKRAVRYPYLDFSTAARRHAALQAELRLNRRTAPDLYIAVHPIVRDGDGLRIGGEGKPVDWILEMRRFPDGALLDEVARGQALDPSLMLRLAERINAFHERAKPVTKGGGSGDIRHVIDGNGESLYRFGRLFGQERIARLIDVQRRTCARHAGLLDARGRTGRIRHVHGDLHLANIALIEGEPVPFDCLEFSEELATSDTLYDLAFLLMDLWHRGQRTQANLVFNRYIDLSGDEEGVRLLPLFLSVRATVRAHVLAATAERRGSDADAEEAGRFLALAESLMEPGTVALLAIGGLSGSGKSAVARAIGGDFGAAPGARILRSDVLRKRLAGLPPEERLPENFYTPLANRAVYDLLADCAARHLSSGFFVIVDAVLAAPDEAARLARVAGHAHVPLLGCWLEAAKANRLARIRDRTGDASDADAHVVQMQAAHGAQPPTGWRVIAADPPLAAVASAVRAHVRQALGMNSRR